MIALALNFCYIFMLEVFRRTWLNIQSRPYVESPRAWPSVSVVIAVRNEEDKLHASINSLREMKYDGVLEIIFIDDGSTDLSAQIIEASGYRLISLPSHIGKKSALSKGIHAATGEWILTTDADCIHTTAWISTMIARGTSTDAKMVCGSCRIVHGPSFSDAFQAMEMYILQASGAACISLGTPLLNTAASLAFRKDAFTAVDGYTAHQNIASGDDTFLLFSIHQKYKGGIETEISRHAQAITPPVKGWINILSQRTRWSSKIKSYRGIFVQMTGLLVFAAAVSWIALLINAITSSEALIYAAIIWILRLVAELRLLRPAMKVSNDHIPAVWQFLMSVVYPFYLLILVIHLFLSKSSWSK